MVLQCVIFYKSLSYIHLKAFTESLVKRRLRKIKCHVVINFMYCQREFMKIMYQNLSASK